jgi:hypothetical protein
VWFDYQTNLALYDSLLNHSLYDKSLNSHTGAIVYLMEQLQQQETKEALIAYALLLAGGAESRAQTAKTLDTAAEGFLQDLCQDRVRPINFDIDNALRKLQQIDLVAKEGENYVAVPLATAIEQTPAVWQRLLQTPAAPAAK